jgi:hypothetical protein
MGTGDVIRPPAPAAIEAMHKAAAIRCAKELHSKTPARIRFREKTAVKIPAVPLE